MRIVPKGEKIAETRLRKGWTQSELARRIGAPTSYISQIESGSRGIGPARAVAICRELKKEFDDLFEFNNSETANKCEITALERRD